MSVIDTAPSYRVAMGSQANEVGNPAVQDADGVVALRNNDAPTGRGMLTMMALLNVLANNIFDAIDKKQKVAQNAQDMANKVEGAIGAITDPTKPDGKLSSEVIKYMRDNGILVSGKSIDEYIRGKDIGKMMKADLMEVKSALDGQANSASNFVTTSQLKIQQILQTYNTAAQMVNSMQSMVSGMTKSIAEAIR